MVTLCLLRDRHKQKHNVMAVSIMEAREENEGSDRGKKGTTVLLLLWLMLMAEDNWSYWGTLQSHNLVKERASFNFHVKNRLFLGQWKEFLSYL